MTSKVSFSNDDHLFKHPSTGSMSQFTTPVFSKPAFASFSYKANETETAYNYLKQTNQIRSSPKTTNAFLSSHSTDKLAQSVSQVTGISNYFFC